MLAKLLRTRLDGDELFKRCKDLQVEIKNLGDKLENMVAERDKLAKVVVDLDALVDTITFLMLRITWRASS